MRSARTVSTAVVLLAIAACGDPTGTETLFDETAVTADAAASAGDAIAIMLGTMADNESFAGGGAEFAGGPAAAPTQNLTVTRSRSCLDAAGATVQNCLPFSSVRTIIIAASINGTRSSTRSKEGGSSVTFTGVVHRSSNDTTRRIFTNTTETSRVHTDVAVGNDTTTFTDGAFTRKVSEAVRDSVKSLTFALPRSANPWPTSGSIVRRTTATVEITKDGKSLSRDVSRRVEVTFPADAQGNVTLKIDAKTCQLNLATRAVTGCQ
jgi:hypothetical protein